MLPAEGVLKAAHRWLNLLNRSSLPQASALIRSDPKYTDLSTTQYASALEWLVSTQILRESPRGLVLSIGTWGLPETMISEELFTHALRELDPPWLMDVDVLVRDENELPADAVDLAGSLELSEHAAWLMARKMQGKVNFAAQARVGALGEAELVNLLEGYRPGSTVHVALTHDGYGYDIAYTEDSVVWHLEVKTTTRRGRLVIYLSRNEYEVSLDDDAWQLVLVGLDETGRIATLATAHPGILKSRSPTDHYGSARWETTRYELGPNDLSPGLPFIVQGNISMREATLLVQGWQNITGRRHAWLP